MITVPLAAIEDDGFGSNLPSACRSNEAYRNSKFSSKPTVLLDVNKNPYNFVKSKADSLFDNFSTQDNRVNVDSGLADTFRPTANFNLL